MHYTHTHTHLHFDFVIQYAHKVYTLNIFINAFRNGAIQTACNKRKENVSLFKKKTADERLIFIFQFYLEQNVYRPHFHSTSFFGMYCSEGITNKSTFLM